MKIRKKEKMQKESHSEKIQKELEKKERRINKN